jgi:hypothetical protein
MRAMKQIFLLLICTVSFTACNQAGTINATIEDRAPTANSAIAAANEYLATMRIGTNDMSVDAIDMGNRWRLAYRGLGTGGGLVVVVNKRSGEVVHAEGYQ